jgi:ABC-type molybdate transport system substrate-binding protein
LLALLLLGLLAIVACGGPSGSQSPLKLEKFSDLARPGVRIGIVDAEQGPAGRYADQVIARFSHQHPEAAVVLKHNIILHAAQVRALLQQFLDHKIDAAFVYRSDAQSLLREKVRVIEIPKLFGVQPRYAMARFRCSPAPRAAQRFYDWLLGPEAEKLWQQNGFRPLSPVTFVGDNNAAISPAVVRAPAPNRIAVFAAAVFADALPRLGQIFKRQTGIIVEYEFNGSGTLYQKIRLGKKAGHGADLFLSAAPSYVAELVADGQAAAGCIFLANDLVVLCRVKTI